MRGFKWRLVQRHSFLIGKVIGKVDKRMGIEGIMEKDEDKCHVNQVEQSLIPKGWKLVPIEPTEEMIQAWNSSKAEDFKIPNHIQSDFTKEEWEEWVKQNAREDWSRMISASPTPPVDINPTLSITKALARYEDLMSSVSSCTDGGCLIRRPKGLHTNGGCKCHRNAMKTARAIYAGNELAETLRKLGYGDSE